MPCGARFLLAGSRAPKRAPESKDGWEGENKNRERKEGGPCGGGVGGGTPVEGLAYGVLATGLPKESRENVVQMANGAIPGARRPIVARHPACRASITIATASAGARSNPASVLFMSTSAATTASRLSRAVVSRRFHARTNSNRRKSVKGFSSPDVEKSTNALLLSKASSGIALAAKDGCPRQATPVIVMRVTTMPTARIVKYPSLVRT